MAGNDYLNDTLLPFLIKNIDHYFTNAPNEEWLNMMKDEDEDYEKLTDHEGSELTIYTWIYYGFAKHLAELAKMPGFLEIKPPNFLAALPGCHLSVKSELEAVDLTLFWLQGQEDRDAFVGEAFSKLRPAYLSPAAKAVIIERAQTLRFSEDSVAKMKMFLNIPYLNRCHNPEHSHLPRCGPVQEGGEMGLPLSRPKVEAKGPEKEADGPKKNEKPAKDQKKEAADVPAEAPEKKASRGRKKAEPKEVPVEAEEAPKQKDASGRPLRPRSPMSRRRRR